MPWSARQFVKTRPRLAASLAGPLALRRAWRSWREEAGDRFWQRLGELAHEDVVLKVGEFDGVFGVGPRSHILRRILLEGEYEPALARLFLDQIKADQDVIDVGANLGFFTVAGARRLVQGRVLAVEPSPVAFSRLQENVHRNQVADRVISFQGLVAEVAGDRAFYSIPGLEEYSAMRRPHHPAVRGQEADAYQVPAVTLDDLVDRHRLRPAVIKVDVEGAELGVFRGARRTLARHRPVVISELWRRTEANRGAGEEVLTLFRQLDYHVTVPFEPGVRPGAEEIGEILCIPQGQGSSE